MQPVVRINWTLIGMQKKLYVGGGGACRCYFAEGIKKAVPAALAG